MHEFLVIDINCIKAGADQAKDSHNPAKIHYFNNQQVQIKGCFIKIEKHVQNPETLKRETKDRQQIKKQLRRCGFFIKDAQDQAAKQSEDNDADHTDKSPADCGLHGQRFIRKPPDIGFKGIKILEFGNLGKQGIYGYKQ